MHKVQRCNNLCGANKQLLDEVFAIFGVIKVGVTVIRLRLITVTETLIIPNIAKTESNNCFIIHCFTGKQNNSKTIPTFVFRLLDAFFLKVFVEQFLRNFCQPFFFFLFSESFCVSNFSIPCSVEEANRRAMNLLRFQMPPTLLLEIMHCARNLQIIH